MCGVVAYYSEKPDSSDIKNINNLIQQSKIRGLHSFGISYLNDNKIKTQKTNDIQDLKIPETNLLIFHNRYTTSGDYKKPINNQPLELNETYLDHYGLWCKTNLYTYLVQQTFLKEQDLIIINQL